MGQCKTKLKDYPERERALWRLFDHVPFERGVALDRLTEADVLGLLDYPSYFGLLKVPLPEDRRGILDALTKDNLVDRTGGAWQISNLGAALFANKLDDFPGLRRKPLRLISYRGDSRVAASTEQLFGRGYAPGFEAIVAAINSLVPPNEIIERALRKVVPVYPELAIRELVANALIHQDFAIGGAGPMVELFEDRLEITNPGTSLIATDRLLDSPPRSRNEALASLMRRIGICEERGSGVDKVVFEIELYQLPAPVFEAAGESTRVVLFSHILFSHRTLNKMNRDDKIRACYLHACLKFVNRQYMTNASLRERFGIEPKNMSIASRLIKEAVEAGVVMPYDRAAAPKLMKYVPFWAAPSSLRPAILDERV